MIARTYEDLKVWQKAHQVVLAVYRLNQAFPREETYGLKSQIRRSAASVPANIAEGFRRSSKTEKGRFYNIALSSLDETQYHLRLAHDLGYCDTLRLRAQIQEVARMLNAYARAVASSDRSCLAFRTGAMLLAGSLVFYSLLASRFSLLFLS